MVQLLFGLGVDNSPEGWFNNALRSLCALFDKVVYQLLSVIYEILFNIANSTIVSSETIKVFYGRVQLIIGVFMIFKLAISLLQFVVNPDAFSDQKKGMGKIITRIITMLFMFTAIMPLNIPNATPGSYNAYLNQNGLLFGTLYSLQARILNQGVIQKLVLGYTTPNTEETNAASGTNEDSGNAMANFLLRVFVRVNVKDINEPIEEDNYMVPENDLKSDDKGAYDVYNDTNASAGDILDNINATDGDHYAFAYFPIVSTICGVIVFVIMCAFCIDVATRALKLAILRLIAPIPIISYIDPKSSEKGSFATWVKMLTSTFLNLFIILAVIHFAIFLVEQLIPNGDGTGLAMSFSDNVIINLLTIVFIIIGIFFFAKQAPKFIMDALGIKGMGLGVGLSGLLGATGAFMGGGGIAGAAAGFLESADASSDAASQGKQAPPAYNTQRDKIAKLQTGDKNAKGGIIGNLTRTANDYANQNMARNLFHIDRNAVGRAKDDMYRLKSEASNAEEAYKRFSTGHMTNEERVDIENGAAFNEYLASKGINDYAGQNADVQNRIMQQYLESDMSNKQTAAAKQESWYKEGQQMLEAFNINETIQEKYASTRTMQRRSDRLYTPRPEGTPPNGYSAPADGHRGYADSHQYRGNENMNRGDQTRL